VERPDWVLVGSAARVTIAHVKRIEGLTAVFRAGREGRLTAVLPSEPLFFRGNTGKRTSGRAMFG